MFNTINLAFTKRGTLSYTMKIKSRFAWKRVVLVHLKNQQFRLKKGCFSRPEFAKRGYFSSLGTSVVYVLVESVGVWGVGVGVCGGGVWGSRGGGGGGCHGILASLSLLSLIVTASWVHSQDWDVSTLDSPKRSRVIFNSLTGSGHVELLTRSDYLRYSYKLGRTTLGSFTKVTVIPGCDHDIFDSFIMPWYHENIYTLSYYQHQIGSMNYYPLFRVRSWNNGVRCMSFYILMDSFTRSRQSTAARSWHQ